MNSNLNQKSQKSEKMAGGRRGNGQDSNMQSEPHTETHRASPLRSAVLRPESTEFKVAGDDFGGARHKTPSASQFVDDKDILPPLGKDVAEEISARRKESGAINHENQELEHHVRVGLKQVAKDSGVPTTIFSSMGGGRTAPSTLVDFGGAGSKTASSSSDLPKEFEYREEDFMPLSQSNSSKHKSAPSAAKVPSQAIKAASAHRSTASAPHHHHHHHQSTDSPESKSSSLPEESSPKKNAPKPTFNTSRPSFKAPAHIANKPKGKHMLHQATPPRREEAHMPETNLGSEFHENEGPSTRHYQQSTQALPKSLDVHAFETPSQSHDTKISSGQQQLHARHHVTVESSDEIDDGPASQHHSLSPQFFAKMSSKSHAPSTAHHSTAAPIHYSAMPPVHHAPPAHHSAPEHHLPAEHITPLHQAGAPVHHTAPIHTLTGVSSDPMYRAHAAPIYHAPSIASQPVPPAHHEGPSRRAPAQIETVHMPHHAPVHAPAHAPAEHHTHIETIHAAYHPEEVSKKKKKKASYGAEVSNKDDYKAASRPSASTLPHAVAATSTSAPAPTHYASNYHPVVALGKSRDESVESDSNDFAPVKSQTDGSELNAASFPSFVHPDASATAHTHHATESSHKAAAMYKGPIHAAVLYHTPPPELHPNVSHVHDQHMPTHTYKPNKRSKRSRKAAKKQEVARSLGVLGSISEALVGRRKNTVSTPVMRLNEIFGEAEGPITPETPIHAHGASIVAPATAVAARLGGIRNLLGAIHMPAMISRHPADLAHHDEHKLASDSAHDTHVAGHMQHKHTPSKAVALKTPKSNLLLFPEEDASYPRGELSKHENPAHPKNFVIRAPAVHAQAAPTPLHRAPLGHMHLDLHTHQAHHQPAVSAQSAYGVGVVHNIHPQHKHSYAAALKKPRVNPSAFPEEQADYPRGDQHHENKPSHPLHKPIEVQEVQLPAAMSRKARRQQKNSKAAALKKAVVPVGAFPEEEATYPRDDGRRHENTPSQPMHKPIEVQEVQLDAAHLHSHHDLHPTMGESAAAAMSHGLESFKAMLGGIHMPAMSNPEAQATIASLGAATAVHEATSHGGEHRIHHDGASLPLVHGTPVHAASAHEPNKPVNVEHHDPHVTHTATAVPLAHVSHGGSAVVPVYIAEPVVQVHDQDPMRHTESPAHAPAPVKATARASTSRKFTPSEQHNRGMDVHGVLDDDDDYFSADDIKSPNCTGAFKLKPCADPSILNHNAPISVLPPMYNATRASSIYVAAPVHAQHASVPASAHDIKLPDTTSASKLDVMHNAFISVLPPDNAIKASSIHATAPVHAERASVPVVAPVAPPVQHSSLSAAPLVATAAAIPMAGAIHHAEKPALHKDVPVSTARIPIAKPPVQMVTPVAAKRTTGTTTVPVKPKAPIVQPPTQSLATPAAHVHGPSISAPFAQTHAPSAPIAPAHTQEPLAPSHTDHAAAAAPFMGIAAARVKPDEVIVMESAMPAYKEAPKRDDAHYIPVSAVAPVIPIKTTSAQASHAQAPIAAPTSMKATTAAAAVPTAPVKQRSDASDMPHKHSHVAAPAAATAAAAAAIHNARNKTDLPVQTMHSVKPELRVHESDVVKPTPLNAAHPVIPASVQVQHDSRTDRVANAPRPIIPQEQMKTRTVLPETQKTVAPTVAAAVETPMAVNAIKPTTATTTYDDPVVKPSEVKVAKPAVERANPVVAAQAVKQEAPVLAKTTHTSTAAPARFPVPAVKHEGSDVSTRAVKSIPIPAVRPVAAAADVAPGTASAVQTTRTSANKTEVPTVSSAQQIQQQYQQSHQTTTASSTSTTRPVDVPIQAASSSSAQTGTTRQADMPIQMQQAAPSSSSSNTVIPPPGYTGAIPTVNEDETVIWVKKTYTTDHYYDSENEDDIDELGHRKDRDVSRYLPGAHLHHSNVNNTSNVVGANAQFQPVMQTNAQFQQPMQAASAQYQHPLQIQSSNAPFQGPMEGTQPQSRMTNTQPPLMTNAQFQQYMNANNAQTQSLTPAQAYSQAQARRPSQPQVHPNNPETRRASQATFKQHLKEYRRRSSAGAANTSQSAISPGKNVSMANKQQHQAAQ